MSLIEVHELSKAYPKIELVPWKDRWSFFTRKAKGPSLFRRVRNRKERILALDEVSFSVDDGEVLGIIGKNGAGKSTLLKVLSRITSPSSGWARLRGRVASLLDIGTGFHPELTGRENVYLNGSLLGMSRQELNSKLEAIADFAEIRDFLDLPVKRYSSGMYVRLAFSVAAHLDSEILIIDEVLAAGDYSFQQKCLERTRLLAQSGRTVLMVSHNMGAIGRLCTRALRLEGGKIVEMGPPSEVIRHYVERSRQDSFSVIGEPDPHKPIQLRAIRLLGEEGTPCTKVAYEEAFRFVVDYEVRKPLRGVSVGLGLGTADQTPVFATADFDTRPERLGTREPGRYRASVAIPGAWLNPGRYMVMVYLANGSEGTVYEKLEALNFEVMETGSPGSRHGANYRRGVLQPLLDWDTEVLNTGAGAAF